MTDDLDAGELERITGLVELARERLVASERETLRLQAVLEAILDVVPPLVAVSDGRVVAWSTSLERLCDVPAAAAIGRPVSAVLPAVGAMGDGAHLLERDGELGAIEPHGGLVLTSGGDGFGSARAPG